MSNLKKSMSLAMGASFVAAMSAAPIANADTSPFGMQNLESGYLQVAEGKCGEGKCGGKAKGEAKKAEGKCGEGKCGGDKGAAKKAEGKCGEGKCGEDKSKKEGKCGEGKCGGKN
jgi:uncharacterized low-complexity protein